MFRGRALTTFTTNLPTGRGQGGRGDLYVWPRLVSSRHAFLSYIADSPAIKIHTITGISFALINPDEKFLPG